MRKVHAAPISPFTAIKGHRQDAFPVSLTFVPLRPVFITCSVWKTALTQFDSAAGLDPACLRTVCLMRSTPLEVVCP